MEYKGEWINCSSNCTGVKYLENFEHRGNLSIALIWWIENQSLDSECQSREPFSVQSLSWETQILPIIINMAINEEYQETEIYGQKFGSFKTI